jgi:ribonucleoside-diphosphate reductase alpha chain
MPAFSQSARAVLEQRYLRRGADGPLETPDGMLTRVAHAVAAAGREFGEDPGYWEERFLRRMDALEFLPNSPTLMNAGIAGGQLAACFVLPIRDDLDSIFQTLGLAARIQQSGGGTGFSFSGLRPRGDLVASTGGISSGPLSFVELFDHATSVIRAGGRRRGANMAVLRVDHPDIEEFITAKNSPGRLSNFNFSVGLTDEFFNALEAKQPFDLRNPRSGRIVRQIDPAAMFDQIVQAAWESGDPGLVFLDEIARHHVTPALGPIEATNPCGEQPLLPYESCILGSLNVSKFVAPGGVLDYARLGEAIADAVVFLDNVIEVNHYPSPEIERATRLTRKIGLGVMGWADYLATAGLPYDCEGAMTIGERLAGFLTAQARRVSIELGERRGSFPAFASSVWPRRGVKALRNATVTCVAPTGTISMLAGCSSGIEPFFALASRRRLLDDRVTVEVNQLAQATLESLGSAGKAALAELQEKGALAGARGIANEIKRRFRIALEISPEDHLLMQAAFQRHIDAAVSKTVNLPSNAKPQVVKEIYLMARQFKLKGVTVYRYGARSEQPLSLMHEDARPDCRECAL